MQISDAQKAAITHYTGPAMVLAGPGSGKTTVITNRVRYLIEEKHVDPARILTITFSKAAALEMEGRFQRMTEGKYRSGFGTFHSVFFRMLRMAYHYDASSIIQGDSCLQIVKRLLMESEKDSGEAEDGSAELAEDLKNAISLVKNNRWNPETYIPEKGSAEQFRAIYSGYEEELRRLGKIDFDDMLTMTYELLSKRPDILAGWQRAYQFLQVDEFQDINQVQYDIVRLLAGKQSNLLIVGDDDQSIYRFRGARPEIMLGFEKDFPGAKRYLLSTNYRSTEILVTAASHVIAHNEKRFPKNISSSRDKGEKLVLTSCHDQKEQSSRVWDKVRKYREMGYAYRDMAVLYRTTLNASGLMQELMHRNIPMKTRDGIPNLFEHWIARDLFCYLRLSMGDRSRATFLPVMNKPNRYLRRDCAPDAVVSFEQLRWNHRDKDWMVERIDRMESDLRIMSRLKPGPAIHYLRTAIGYDTWLEEYAGRQKVDPADWKEILDSLEESAGGFEKADEWFYYAEEFSEKWKEEEQSRQSRSREEDCITLSTMHSAKGLEFPIVFLISCNDGVIPHRKGKSAEDLEEERRLFYVGMTRAKDRLHLMYVDELYGKKAKRSPFIEEIRGESKNNRSKNSQQKNNQSKK